MMSASILPTPPAPPLPDFKTLLIQGDYPVSSPFHLCLSFMSGASDSQSRSRPLLVTAKTKAKIIEGLVDLNDDWLIANAGLGATAVLLSDLRIYYPSTPDHWTFLFALFQSGVPNDLEALSPNPNIHLDPPVSLVILHEPSAYFLDHDPPRPFTMASYLGLITSALASLPFLDRGTGPPRLAVFDSRLHDLSMPILPIAMTDPIDDPDEYEHKLARKHDKVVLAVERYFEWVGKVETGKSTSLLRTSIAPYLQLRTVPPPTSDLLGNQFSPTHRMCFSPSQHLCAKSVTWEWCQMQRNEPGKVRTVFEWP